MELLSNKVTHLFEQISKIALITVIKSEKILRGLCRFVTEIQQVNYPFSRYLLS